MPLISLLNSQQKGVLQAVRSHAERLLDHSPRFRFFTLHGSEHIRSLFEIADILVDNGIELSEDEAYYLSLAICVHDLGMVLSLKEADRIAILDGKPESPDPAVLEEAIRETHHELVDHYTRDNFSFLAGLGLSMPALSNVVEISKCHRKVVLEKKSGFIRSLGALLRVIDELDLSERRAPIERLYANYLDFDATSTWHWFKHNISGSWRVGDNVNVRAENGRKMIDFVLVVHPTKEDSVTYWLHQIRRPIQRALIDNGCAEIIRATYGVQINLKTDSGASKPVIVDPRFVEIEERALSSGRKVILVIDDEHRKLIDLFVPLMEDYYVMFAATASDAIEKAKARTPDLAVIDVQLGSGGIWTEQETGDYKLTGAKIVEEFSEKFPRTKLCVLTGTMHRTDLVKREKLALNLRKPIDPDVLKTKITNVLR